MRLQLGAATCLMDSAWRASTSATALETACWICCCTSCGEGVTAATGANAVRTGTGAGRVAAKKIEAESRSAEANARRAVDPQKPLTQRRSAEGSKTWSLTKAMRCGISSSRKEKRAADR